MTLDVNIIWIKNGFEQQKPIRIDIASEIFESNDITTNDFWNAVKKERIGSLEFHEHLLIDIDRRYIEMDGMALRYDWFSIKSKLLKLRKYKWHIIQMNYEIINQFHWFKEEPPPTKVGKGWHGEKKMHSIKRKIGHIKKKYKEENDEIT